MAKGDRIFVPTKKEHDDLKKVVSEHQAKKVHEGDVHGMRVNDDGNFEFFDGVEWKRVKSDGFRVGNISNFSASEDNQTVTLTWQDPPDTTIEDSSGSIITISEWEGTLIRRKLGSYPIDENDGDLVVDSAERNQYQTNGFVDTGLMNETTYYYMAFPYTAGGLFTVDAANRLTATPSEMDDTSGSPGSTDLIAGTMDAGYFGTVSSSQLISGTALASNIGLSAGTNQHSAVDWLKFVVDGKIIFTPMKPFKHTVSWDQINAANAVNGSKTITIGGLTYKVRLWRGAENDPSNYTDADRDAIGSEWNRLMLPIHENAPSNWAYPQYGGTTEDWGIDFSDADLLTHHTHGNGSYTWCQEVRGDNTAYRVIRGYLGVSNSLSNTSSVAHANYGWRPVLELL